MSGDLTFGMRLSYDGKAAVAGMAETKDKLDAITTSGSKMASQYSGMNQAIRENTSATQQSTVNLGKLLDRYDPLGAKLRQLQKDFQALNSAASSGKIGVGDDARVDLVYANLQKQMIAASGAANGFIDTSRKAALSAGQLRMATAQLPMQFTDIWVSLAAGQSPMMVMLQQGSQIKDSFGGVGNAAKAMGAYIMGLINPITLTAAAAVAGAYAWYKWGDSAKEAATKARAAADDAAKASKAAWSGVQLSADEQVAALESKMQGALGLLDAAIKKRNAVSRSTSAEVAMAIGAELIARKQEIEGYQRNIDQIRAAEDKKAAADAKKKEPRTDGLQVLIGLEREYQAELDKRKDAMASPLLTESERNLAESMRQTRKAAQDARIELEKLHAADKGLSDSTYAARKADVDARERVQIESLRRLQAEQDKLNASWEYGARVSIQKYQDAAANTAVQVEKAMTGITKSMEDQEVSMLRKSGANWRALADTIINELLRIQVAKANAGLMNMIFGSSGGSATADAGLATYLEYRASGGPVASNSLYQINEKGPELLNYGGNDYLMMGGKGGFVKPLGSDGVSSGSNITMQVNIDARGNGDVQSNDQSYTQLGNKITSVCKGVILDEMRPGGLLARAA